MTTTASVKTKVDELRVQLQELVGKTAVIENAAFVADHDIAYCENGMKARICNAIVTLNPSQLVDTLGEVQVYLEFDYTPFEDHNTPLETNDWTNGNGENNHSCKSLDFYTGRDFFHVSTDNPTRGLKLLD